MSVALKLASQSQDLMKGSLNEDSGLSSTFEEDWYYLEKIIQKILTFVIVSVIFILLCIERNCFLWLLLYF